MNSSRSKILSTFYGNYNTECSYNKNYKAYVRHVNDGKGVYLVVYKSADTPMGTVNCAVEVQRKLVLNCGMYRNRFCVACPLHHYLTFSTGLAQTVYLLLDECSYVHIDYIDIEGYMKAYYKNGVMYINSYGNDSTCTTLSKYENDIVYEIPFNAIKKDVYSYKTVREMTGYVESSINGKDTLLIGVINDKCAICQYGYCTHIEEKRNNVSYVILYSYNDSTCEGEKKQVAVYPCGYYYENNILYYAECSYNATNQEIPMSSSSSSSSSFSSQSSSSSLPIFITMITLLIMMM